MVCVLAAVLASTTSLLLQIRRWQQQRRYHERRRHHRRRHWVIVRGISVQTTDCANRVRGYYNTLRLQRYIAQQDPRTRRRRRRLLVGTISCVHCLLDDA